MILSMTAFAREQQQGSWGQIVWEVRTLNHRYLEVYFRLPEMLRDLEPKLREIAAQHLQRGKVECSVRFQPGSQWVSEISLNKPLLKQLVQSCEEIGNEFQTNTQIDISTILQWPGLVVQQDADLASAKEKLLSSFENVMKNIRTVRAREGDVLQKLLESRLSALEEQLVILNEKIPGIIAANKQRLTDRFHELLTEIDQSRLEQELVILSQKMDVAEELDRLQTHIKELGIVLKKGGSVGRRLDFFMQELNRETNTLGVKVANSVITQAVVEMKVLIEQMREQIQNIE